jgi:prepilin-type N-terminal cleavage/methylation domain-containing protein
MKKQLGFTLVEILIVMAVLGVMAGVVISVLNPQGETNRENDTKRKGDLSVIQLVLERYKAKEGVYPSPNPAGRIGCDSDLTSLDGNTNFGTIPCAPNGDGTNYFYTVSPQNDAYCLRACFVNTLDPLRDEKNTQYCSGAGCDNPSPGQMGSTCSGMTACGGARRSYTVLSP